MSVLEMSTSCYLIGGLLLVNAVNAENYSFDSEQWLIEANEAQVMDYQGRKALMLKGGSAILKDLELTDGIIEFDISIGPERGFSGCRFRMHDADDFEHFYIRPHQSGNPDANQYTPVFNGISAWQLYHGAGYGVPVQYRYDEWMHVKLVFAESRAEVFIDSEVANLRIGELKRQVAAGRVGVDASNLAAAYFSNFEVSPLPQNYEFAELETVTIAQDETIVSSWLISDAFDSASLDAVQELEQQHKEIRHWTPLEADPGGVTNLARVQGLGENRNTVFARLKITSDRHQIKALNFGYSDSVAVYANGVLLYQGNNGYRSRDYRYLGTIGLFDAVHLPLMPGDNEIWFAVTEAFGGWGIKAQFDDLQGIVVQNNL